MPPHSDSANPPPSTYAGIWKYPTNRDAPFRMVEDWLQSKQIDDDIDGLWRVHDRLYDLQPFINKHPGGSQWLEMTRGTDITEAFEASHVVNVKGVETMLEKFYVRDATHPRISPYTFKKDGFYLTLKRRVEPVLKEIGTGSTTQVLLIQDSLVLSFVICGILGTMWNSNLLSVFSGIFLGFSTIVAHNFFHMKENSRRYYFDLSLLSSYEWRISHAFSHHLYPNSLLDLELSLFPTYEFLPNRKKLWFQRKFSIIYSHLIYALGFWLDLGKRIYHIAQGRKPLRLENLLVLLEIFVLMVVSNDLGIALRTWMIFHTVSSYVVLTIGATAAHHHPDIFHDGDEPLEDNDFGIGQLEATRDRAEDIFQNLFVTMITFGQHPLHHLFPTVCHSKLAYIRKIFEDTVREFNLNYPGIPQKELYLGCYEQLARTEIVKRKKIE